jgi:DNA-binding transcriptional MerR regulator
MAQYSIKELEEISSMKAHTIRIWELRYGLLQPLRTDTNIRYYDDMQLKKLLNVCALLSEGMKISKISELNEKQIGDAIDQIINKSSSTDVSIETIINQLLIAVTTFDELMFDKVFSNAVLRLGLVDTYLKVIYPLLVRVGLMWSKDDVMPAQEHFFSNLIKQKIFAAIDATPLPQNADQTWLLFLPETESHEIGLLLIILFVCMVKK